MRRIALHHRSAPRSGLVLGCIALACFSIAPAQAATVPAATAPTATAPAPQRETGQATHYVRVGELGAKLYNVWDTKGVVVLEPPAGSLLAVYGELSGYLDVEAPGGLPVWVFGRYLLPTAQDGVLAVTGDDVLMRPLPASSERSFPLGQRLYRGDRVRLIERADAQKPMSEDWVHVWSPPGTRAWVKAERVSALAPGSDVAAEWASAARATRAGIASSTGSTPSRTTPSSTTPSRTTREAAAPAAEGTGGAQPAAGGELRERFLAAEEKFQAARAGQPVDFAALRASYRDVMQTAPQSSYAKIADTRLSALQAIEEFAVLQQHIATKKLAREAELERLEGEIANANAKKDPLWGRFHARGWLEREDRGRGQEPVHVVRWGGDVVAQLVCSSGRFELEVFEGYEVGINGLELGFSNYAAGSMEKAATMIDIARIEVISGRYTGKL